MEDYIHDRSLAPICSRHEFIPEITEGFVAACNRYFCRFCGIYVLEHQTRLIEFYRPPRLESGCILGSTPQLTLQSLVKHQKINRPLQGNLVNLQFRAESITILTRLCIHLQIGPATYFKTLAIMDWVVSTSSYQENEYKIILIVSLMIACKLNESKLKVPSQQEVADFLNPLYNKQDIGVWETKILSQLNWQVDIKTTHDFTEFLLNHGALSTRDFPITLSPMLVKMFLDSLDEIVRHFLRLVVLDFRFYRFTPLSLAAAIIACARGMLGLKLWCTELKLLSGVTLESLRVTVEVLMSATNDQSTTALFMKIIREKFGGHSVPSTPAEFDGAEKRIRQLQRPFFTESENLFRPSNVYAKEVDLCGRDTWTNYAKSTTCHPKNNLYKKRVEVRGPPILNLISEGKSDY